MRAGRLRHRVTVEKNGNATDSDFAGTSDTWTTHVTSWASIRPLSGKELVNARQIRDNVTHEVRMRYQSGVTSAMRVTEGSRSIYIQSVRQEDNETDRELILLCSEEP